MKAVILIPYINNGFEFNTLGNEAFEVYSRYFKESKSVDIAGNPLLINNDDVGLFNIGIGKLNSAINLTNLINSGAINNDACKFILFGCCGAAYGKSMPGDVNVANHVVDLDFGSYVTDNRDLENYNEITWYPFKLLSDEAHYSLESKFVQDCFKRVKQLNLETNKKTIELLDQSFPEDDWFRRTSTVNLGTFVNSDSYWKGHWKNKIANFVVDYYNIKNHYVCSSMEEIGICKILKLNNLLDKLLCIRFAINMDVFLDNQKPSSLWMGQTNGFSDNDFDGFSFNWRTALLNGMKVFDCIYKFLT